MLEKEASYPSNASICELGQEPVIARTIRGLPCLLRGGFPPGFSYFRGH